VYAPEAPGAGTVAYALTAVASLPRSCIASAFQPLAAIYAREAREVDVSIVVRVRGSPNEAAQWTEPTVSRDARKKTCVEKPSERRHVRCRSATSDGALDSGRRPRGRTEARSLRNGPHAMRGRCRRRRSNMTRSSHTRSAARGEESTALCCSLMGRGSDERGGANRKGRPLEVPFLGEVPPSPH